MAVVASQYHPEYTSGLVAAFMAELSVIGPGFSVARFDVPGAFEIPVVAAEIVARGGYDAVINFGVILSGATAHAALISGAVTDALMRLAVQHRVPMIHEVLVLETEEQARERCLEEKLNRGTEAARAAVGVISAIAKAKGR